MKLEIVTAPISEIRNQQVGDWRHNPDGSITAIAAEMEDTDHSFLIGLHELIEAYLCRKRGITDEEVTEWDQLYEDHRKPGDESENGDHPSAPYYREHVFATNIERLVAAEIGVHWTSYEAAVNALFKPQGYFSGPDNLTQQDGDYIQKTGKYPVK